MDKGIELGRRLCFAAMNNDHITLRQLIDRGAAVDTPGDFGESALIAALRTGRSKVAAFLLERSANAIHSDQSGRQPIHYAGAQRDNIILIRHLQERGADINGADLRGWTPLMVACMMVCDTGVTALIRAGARPAKPNIEGNTELLCLLDSCHGLGNRERMVAAQTIINHLLQSGVAINHQNMHGKTALHLAAEKDYIDVIPCLLQAGADLALLTIDGHSPITSAAINGQLRTAKLLQQEISSIDAKTAVCLNDLDRVRQEIQRDPAVAHQVFPEIRHSML